MKKQIKLNSKKEKLKQSTKKFNRELKKSMNTAIVAGFGFLIALVWKELITEYVDALTLISPVQGKLISAIIVSFVCVVGILIVTKILKVEE